MFDLSGKRALVTGATGGIGGAINLIPRSPEFDASSAIRVLAGEFGTAFVGLDLTGPLGDRDQDGVGDNDDGGQQRHGGNRSRRHSDTLGEVLDKSASSIG